MENEDYREMLESKRFDIVQHLQIDRTFVFDYLRHKGVLDSEDCELIQSEKTTSLKIGKFVDVLARKGAQAYQYLLESLQLEHPALYEKLTGEEADATTSPIMMKLKKSFIGVGGPLGNSELEILTGHLERTYGDLHAMSRRFEQVVQHKKSIEEQLETTTSDLERHKEKVNFLKKKIDSDKSHTVPARTDCNWMQCVQYVDSMRKEVSDRDIYIIALQTNLMSSREEMEGLKKKNSSLLLKNDELQKMLHEMNESFHKKKCETLRLSERIERQGNEINKAEQTMRKYRECQFHNMRLREEKELLQEELAELKKWTEALKTRYDIVEYEKKKTLSDHTVIMADIGSLQEELMRGREEMNEVQLVAADLRERVRHLEHDRQTYKRQRDGAFTARREAILDRDKAFLERDQADKRYDVLKAESDAATENKILQVKSYDEVVARCDVMEEEVKHAKTKLRQTERELQELKVKYGIEEVNDEKTEDGRETEICCESNVPIIKVVHSNGVTSGNVSEESESLSRIQGNIPSSNTIVESIKRRVAPPSSNFTGPSSPTTVAPFSPTTAGPFSPTFAGLFSPTFPNSESISSDNNPLSTSSLNFAAFPPTRALSNFLNESHGLERKGITRTAIKMRQNSREELLETEGRTRSLPSDNSEGDVTEANEGGGNPPPAPSEGVSEEQNTETSSASTKVIKFL